MQPRLETSQSGSKVLIVPYRGNEFNEAIEIAERKLGVKDDVSITVIALPDDRSRHGGHVVEPRLSSGMAGKNKG